MGKSAGPAHNSLSSLRPRPAPNTLNSTLNEYWAAKTKEDLQAELESMELVCPILRSFLKEMNRRVDDEKRRIALGKQINALERADNDPEVTRKRVFMMVDWAVRDVLSGFAERKGHAEFSDRLLELPPITDAKTCRRPSQVAYSMVQLFELSTPAYSARSACIASWKEQFWYRVAPCAIAAAAASMKEEPGMFEEKTSEMLNQLLLVG